MPGVTDTILRKICSSDVFVWDATIIATRPRPSPNANVLFELGFAVAVLGWGRIIGVMNDGTGFGPDALPFDVRHRRWPVRYKLTRWSSSTTRKAAKKSLEGVLAEAIETALKEPRGGALRADIDLLAARRLWTVISSNWLRNWHEGRMSLIQYEERRFLDVFNGYIRMAELPECSFSDERLAGLHRGLLAAVHKYLSVVAIQMVPDRDGTGDFVVSIKAHSSSGFIEGYDAKYEKQCLAVENAANSLWTEWLKYSAEIAARFPEVIDSPQAQPPG
jgi:hypothetical protein